jgi:hypothetical protein
MKRIAKKIRIICISLFLILLLALGVFTIVLKVKNNRFIGQSDKQFVNYLNQNKIVLNQKTYESGQTLFDDETYKSNVILLGESHGAANVQSIDKEIFLHLNKKLGVRYYLAEMDSIRANRLNNFLCGLEKDTVLLKKIVIDIRQRIPQQSSVELYEKWSDIYDYNTTLPDTLKLSVIGVDTDFDSDSPISRDSAMIQNFKCIVKKKKIETEQFYGLFGLFHVLQNGVNSDNFQPFGARLKTNGFKTTSIACLYIDSKIYLPKNNQIPTPPSEQIGFLNMDGPLVLVKGINDLKKTSNKNEATLFNLKAVKSPYFKSKKLITMKTNFFNQVITPFNEQLSTTDFVQYAIIIRNSKALTPIK